ncbi:MAG: hypothetical protein QM650_09130, partial [Microlunatus sp.]
SDLSDSVVARATTESDNSVDLSDAEDAEPYNRSDLQALMWESVGLSRTAAGLTEALATLRRWRTPEVTDAKSAEDANLLLVARAVTACALRRTESRGGHYRADFPATDPAQATHSALSLTGAAR